MTKTPHELVMEWHQAFNVPVGNPDDPWWPSPNSRLELRIDLIREEFKEFEDAMNAPIRDFIGAVDALGDMVYVIYGMAIEMGINLDLIIEEIHRSNMSKLDENSDPIYREDGKVLKGPLYSPPDLRKVLNEQPAYL